MSPAELLPLVDDELRKNRALLGTISIDVL
jgi:hypothetical protein